MAKSESSTGTPYPPRPDGEGWVKCEICKADHPECPYCKGLGWYRPEKVADDGGEA